MILKNFFTQKLLQNNERWLVGGVVFISVYFLARILFLGVDGEILWIVMSCLVATLCGALLNAADRHPLIFAFAVLFITFARLTLMGIMNKRKKPNKPFCAYLPSFSFMVAA